MTHLGLESTQNTKAHKRVPFLDLWNEHSKIHERLINAFEETLQKSDFIQGPSVRNFERQFADFHGPDFFCTSCANGTDALVLAIDAVLGRGDGTKEILIPANSFFATAEAACLCGYKPVFVDPDPNFYTISIEDTQKKIGKNTVAIIPVHLYGQMANMEAVADIAKRYSLKIIEDSAQAHGALWNSQPPGTLSEVATYSFYPGKNLGALGDAGCLVTKNAELSKMLSKLANHGRASKYEHDIIGYNSRLDALQAKVLSLKLENLNDSNQRRREIAALYEKYLDKVSELVLPKVDNMALHSFHLYVIRSESRDKLAKFLLENGVETGIHYPVSLTKLTAMKDLEAQYKACPISEEFSQQLLSLPMGPHLSNDQVLFVSEVVKRFFS